MKKAYSTPTLVKHGDAVEATLGWGTKFLEFINWRPTP
ncbi:MAG TPA: lasso RiPP family leader peptide-containing protein [Longimicrobiaceae bacterium]|nr:lasso RiPP family leader peptide-containing protein [Longimicrobiaceae bacterium]